MSASVNSAAVTDTVHRDHVLAQQWVTPSRHRQLPAPMVAHCTMRTIHIWGCAAFLVVMVIVPQQLAELAEGSM
jgi:hypothetical protein